MFGGLFHLKIMITCYFLFFLLTMNKKIKHRITVSILKAGVNNSSVMISASPLMNEESEA